MAESGLGALGYFHEGIALCEKGVRNAMDLDELVTLGGCEWQFAWLFMYMGDTRQIIKHTKKSMK